MVQLNFGDIQGNILRSYKFLEAAHSFITVPDAERGRRLLRDLLPAVTDAGKWRVAPKLATNVAVTHAGLEVLQAEPAALAALPWAFTEPIRERAARELGDTGKSAPEHWEDHLGGRAHIVVLHAAKASDASEQHELLCKAVAGLDDSIEATGATCLERQWVKALPRRREHFGYADGFGQPAVEGVKGNLAGQGTPEPDTGAWRDIRAGEFILGYPDEDGERLSGDAAWLLRDGTFMVYRKLEQDVELFRRTLHAQAGLYRSVTGRELSDEAAFEVVAAKLVGRWRDGVALELWPNRVPEGSLEDEANPHVDNDFRYAEDPGGYVCPRGAHVRRANPRDVLESTGRHRILRRGLPYGKDYDEDKDDDRGLIFISFQADLERQFEVVQARWCGDGNAFGLGRDQDYLLGNGTGDGKVTIEGEPPVIVPRHADLVVTKGCDYLLMPGLAALEQLAAPDPAQVRHERVPAGETEAGARVVELVDTEMRRDYAGARPVRRGQHTKSHGCVRARFEVPDDVPDDLRWGLFAEAREYDALIRFSASNAVIRSDAKPDAQGMSIKVKGVTGEKVLPQERWATTQDFVMVDHDVFFCRDALDYVAFAEALLGPGHLPVPRLARAALFYVPPHQPWRWRLNDAQTLWKMLHKPVRNPLRLQYWSQTPYALGPHAIKFTARPVGAELAPGPEPASYDELLDAVAESLKPRDAELRFELLVQRQADPHTMPVEDPTVRWSEAESPFRKVADIRIPHQEDVLAQAWRNYGESLRFTPWHTLWEHRPLGGINRTRRAVYVASSRYRLRRNATSRLEEPGGGRARQAPTSCSRRRSPARRRRPRSRVGPIEPTGMPRRTDTSA